MLRDLLLLAFLLASAFGFHERAATGYAPARWTAKDATATDQLPGLDPDGRQGAAVAPDLLGGLDPDGAK
jgi:hypothetical protein